MDSLSKALIHEQSHHYLSKLFGTAKQGYMKLRNAYPELLESLDIVVATIAVYGEPFANLLDDQLERWVLSDKHLRPFPSCRALLQEFHRTASKAYKLNSYQEFLREIHQSYPEGIPRPLQKVTWSFYESCEAYGTPPSFPQFLAEVLSEGNTQVSKFLVSTWNFHRNFGKNCFFSAFKLKFPEYSRNASVFYDIMFEENPKNYRERVSEIAESTCFLALEVTDDLLEWSLEIFDNKVFTLLVPKYNVTGENLSRLSVMYRRLLLFLKVQCWSIQKSKSVESLSDYFQISKKASYYSELLKALKSSNLNNYSEKTSPEQLKNKFKQMLEMLGLGRFAEFLDAHMWKLMDIDGDGVVSLSDLILVVKKFNPWFAVYLFIHQYHYQICYALRTSRRRLINA